MRHTHLSPRGLAVESANSLVLVVPTGGPPVVVIGESFEVAVSQGF